MEERELDSQGERSTDGYSQDHQENRQPPIDIELLKSEQNFTKAIIAGAVACLVCAGVWAAVTVLTGYQIGYMAIGVGFAVGIAVRTAGKGIELPFGIIGAAFALIGTALGNYFSIVQMGATEMGVSFGEAFSSIQPAMAIELMKETSSGMDLLFYGFAGYFGFKNSFTNLQQD